MKSKEKETKIVRLRKISRSEWLSFAINDLSIPYKCRTRAEREAATFKIELENSENELIDVLLGHSKPRLCKDSLDLTFRSLLDFHASKEWKSQAHDRVQVIMFMLAQLARQIGSCALEAVLRLRIECATSRSYTNARADQLAARFATCWNLVMAEYELLDDKERRRISVHPPRPEPRFSYDFNPYDNEDMPPEERTAAARKYALERLHERLSGYIAVVNRKQEVISKAADQFAANEPFRDTVKEFFGDLQDLHYIFETETDIYYPVHTTKYDFLDSLPLKNEKTDETLARESFVAEIGRFLDSVAARARRIGSKAANEFISANTILFKRQGDFSVPEVKGAYSRHLDEQEKAEIRDDLKLFLGGFVEAYNGFLKDLDASNLGGEAPVEVKIGGYTEEGKKQTKEVVNAKSAEQDYFSDANICRLFEVSKNTPANWRLGKVAAPEGFKDALLRKDGKALFKCAERYKANRAKGDAMNTKHVKRGLSEEQISRESL